MKKIIFLALVCLLVVNHAKADIRVSALASINASLSSGPSSTSKELQSKSSMSGHQFEFAILGGEKGGLLYSLGYNSEREEYKQNQTSDRSLANFRSTYNFPFFKIGYWKYYSSKNILEFALRTGVGTFDFEKHEQNNESKKLNSVWSLAAEARFVWPINLNTFKLDILASGGISKVFVPDFTYQGIKYESKEFDAYPYLALGLGIRF